MNKILYIAIRALVILSCQNSSEKGESFLRERIGVLGEMGVDEIPLNDNKAKILDVQNSMIDTLCLSSIIDSIRHVRLETTKESIIGSIRRIVCVDTLLYISDFRGIVKCFNDKGKYLHTVFTIGEGSQEVARPYDFDADEKGVYVLDGARVRILTFDHKGSFVKAKYLPYRDTIYKFTDNCEMKAEYKLNFGKYAYKLPKDIEKIDLATQLKSGLFYSYKNPINSQKYILQSFISKDRSCTLIVDIQTGFYAVIHNFINDRNDIVAFNPITILGYNDCTDEFVMDGISYDSSKIDGKTLKK